LNESVRAGTNSTTSAINVLAGAVNGMAAVAQAAVSAAQSAAASAAAASSAASSAADKVSLVQAQPTYIYDIGAKA
jgi:methyl-accepting chemotaxis protein